MGCDGQPDCLYITGAPEQSLRNAQHVYLARRSQRHMDECDRCSQNYGGIVICRSIQHAMRTTSTSRTIARLMAHLMTAQASLMRTRLPQHLGWGSTCLVGHSSRAMIHCSPMCLSILVVGRSSSKMARILIYSAPKRAVSISRRPLAQASQARSPTLALRTERLTGIRPIRQVERATHCGFMAINFSFVIWRSLMAIAVLLSLIGTAILARVWRRSSITWRFMIVTASACKWADHMT